MPLVALISYCLVALALFLVLSWFHSRSTVAIPRLYAKSGKLKSLLQQCPSLSTKYVPPFWCPFGSMQTVVRQIIKKSSFVPFQREILPLPDGGQVALDWFMPDVHTPNTPVIILLPGLTGSTFENYIMDLIGASYRRGYKTVVFNNRGNGGIELLTSQTYNAAYTDDFQFVVGSVTKKNPEAKCMAVGLSLGGMILFNYLSKSTPETVGLSAAMVVSSPWDPFRSTESLETFFNWLIFNRRLASNLCRNLAKNRVMFMEKVNFEHIMASQSVREFDERFIVPMFGYKNIDEYYYDAGFYYKIDRVPIPTLCLNAADDCFAPIDSIPFDDVQRSNNVAVAVTSHGGHIAFLKGLTGLGDSLIEDIFSEYSTAILNGF